MDYPPAFRRLVQAFRQLPSVGPRTAERFTLHLLEQDAAMAKSLGDSILEVRKAIRPCASCGFFAEEELCPICQDPTRDPTLACVVAHARDVIALEKSAAFRGRYYVLGGVLSPLDGVGPEELRLDRCWQELERRGVREVILALGSDVAGETTGIYLAGEMKQRGWKVSRLATGIAVGGDLEFVDSVTLGRALAERRAV
ncbi:MAG: recombination mediator RecR [Candidatus Methylacidiphilales bacterium]